MALRESGLDLIREYIPDSHAYDPEDEPGQYNIPYVPQLPVGSPPFPDYIPSAINNVPDLDQPEEDDAHVKFADPPASPPPKGDVSMEITPGTPNVPGQLYASVHPASDADITLHPENSGPPKGKPIPVHKS